MEIIKDTELELGTRIWSLDPPQPFLLLVMKATFDLTSGDVARPAPEQDPCVKDLPQERGPDGTLRYASDFAFDKPRAEVLLMGDCHAPEGEAVTQLVAKLRVGDVGRSFAVFGDRFWKWGMLGRAPTDPAPFTSMPLRWSRAFGGPGSEDKPVGLGIGKGRSGAVFLPNLEDPEALIRSPWNKPKPAGAFPIPADWKARITLFGTCDQRWRETRHPFFPEDFDPAYYNVAPPELRRDAPFRGDESIELKNLVRGHPRISTRLPGLRARAFVEWDGERGGAFDEVPLGLDTVTLDTDRGLALCLWRGRVDLPGEALEPTGVARIFAMDEHLSAETPVERCRERMELKLVEREALSELADISEASGELATMFSPEPAALADPVGFRLPDIPSDGYDDMPSIMVRLSPDDGREPTMLLGPSSPEEPSEIPEPSLLVSSARKLSDEWEEAATKLYEATVEMRPMTFDDVGEAAEPDEAPEPEPEDPFAADGGEATGYYVKLMRKMREGM